MNRDPIPIWVRDDWRTLFAAVRGVRLLKAAPDGKSRLPSVIDHRDAEATLIARPSYPVIVALPSADLGEECRWLALGADACLFMTENLAEEVPACTERARARRTAMNRVRKTDLQYRAMVENLLDVVTLIDGFGVIGYESPSIEEVFGYTPTELVGHNSMELVHPADVAGILQLIAEGRDVPLKTATAQYRFRHKDGTWRVVESKAVNLLHDVSVQSIVVITRDITERQRGEDAVRASQARLAALLEATPDAYVLVDAQGIYHDVHIPADYPSTQTAASLVGKNLKDVLNPPLASQALTAVRQVLETGKPTQFEYSLEVNGQVRFREARVVPFSRECALSVQRDISDRVKALEQLRLSEFRFRSLFEASPDAIFVEDLNGVVLDVNPAACELHDAEREWLLGRHITELVPESERDNVRRGFQELVEGRIQRGEGTSLTKSGETIPIEFRVGHTVYGDLPALLLHVRDISHQRQQEDMIRRLASFQQQAIEKERARISREVHDVLGQALTGLRFDLSRLGRRLGDRVGPDVLAATSAIDGLIADVRRIASDLRPGILDDLGIGAAVEWHARAVAKRSGLAIQLDVNPDLSLGPDQSITLFRVLQELLTNVVRHAEATTISVQMQRIKRQVVLTVADDGRGMEHHKEDERRSLGLLGMRERLQVWSGTLTLSPNSPRGTVATVNLPISAEKHDNEGAHSR